MAWPLYKTLTFFTHSGPWFAFELCQLKAKALRLEHLYERSGHPQENVQYP